MTNKNTAEKVKEVQQKVAEKREDIIQFMYDIVAIPSMESKIGAVGEIGRAHV